MLKKNIIWWGNILQQVVGWWSQIWWTDLFCDVLAALQVMVSVREDLWLHNRHQAVLVEHIKCQLKISANIFDHNEFISVENMAAHTHLLADTGISGKDVRVLCNGESWRAAVWDLEHTPPLGKVTTVLLILGTALREAVKTCRKTKFTDLAIKKACTSGHRQKSDQFSPCVVVSPFVPLRPAVPLSTWNQKTKTHPLAYKRQHGEDLKTRTLDYTHLHL